MVRSFFGRDFSPGEAEWSAGGFDAAAWAQLEEMGLSLLTTPEERGGSGASLAEAAVLLHALGRAGAQVPYGEHDLLAGWLANRAGLPDVQGPTSVVLVGEPVSAGATVSAGGASGVSRLLVVARGQGEAWTVQDLSGEAFEAVATGDEPGTALRSEVRITADAEARALDAADGRELRARGALVRALLIVGSLERSVAESVQHASVRTQFGRPLTRFQAVQALLAEAAAETAAATAAVEAAVVAWIEAGEFTVAVERAVAVAKSMSSHAVDPVTRNAHQVFGAIGTTREHALHRFTLPPLGWRHDFGGAAEWDEEFATGAVAAGAGALWASIAAA